MRKLIIPKPKEGSERLIQRFLFLPLTLNDDWRWLTWVTIRQIYIAHRVKSGIGDTYRFGWVDGQFEDETQLIVEQIDGIEARLALVEFSHGLLGDGVEKVQAYRHQLPNLNRSFHRLNLSTQDRHLDRLKERVEDLEIMFRDFFDILAGVETKPNGSITNPAATGRCKPPPTPTLALEPDPDSPHPPPTPEVPAEKQD